jgi:hypothetical protein
MVAHMYSVLGARSTCTATARAVSCTRRRHNTPSSLHRAISARAPICAALFRLIASWLSMVAHDQRSCRGPWARIADECWAECDPFYVRRVVAVALRNLGHRCCVSPRASHLTRCGVRRPVGSVPFLEWCVFTRESRGRSSAHEWRSRGSVRRAAQHSSRLGSQRGSV